VSLRASIALLVAAAAVGAAGEAAASSSFADAAGVPGGTGGDDERCVFPEDRISILPDDQLIPLLQEAGVFAPRLPERCATDGAGADCVVGNPDGAPAPAMSWWSTGQTPLLVEPLFMKGADTARCHFAGDGDSELRDGYRRRIDRPPRR